MYYSVYYGVLRILRNFITEITVLFKNFAKSGPKTVLLGEIGLNLDLFITDITEYYRYYGIFYYGILQKITIRNVSPLW